MANQGTKLQKIVNDSLVKLDTVQTVLSKLPTLDESLLAYGQSEIDRMLGKLSPSPQKYLEEVITRLEGQNKVIQLISMFLEIGLPAIEMAMKAALIANMAELGVDCNINPIITDKIIKEGVIFDLKQIDLYDKLRISPLDPQLGRFFYFGCDNCATAAEVRASALYPHRNLLGKYLTWNVAPFADNRLWEKRTDEKKGDFDALLWYMTHKAQGREVWYKRSEEPEYEIVEEIKRRRGYVGIIDGKITYDKSKKEKQREIPLKRPKLGQDKKPLKDGLGNVIMEVQKDSNGEVVMDKVTNRRHYTKKDGILTLEFSPRAGNLKQSNGNAMSQQTPYDNVLHVFIGNCKELQVSKEAADNASRLDELSQHLTTINNLYNRMMTLRQECEKKLEELTTKQGDLAANEKKTDKAQDFESLKKEYEVYRNFSRILDMQLGTPGSKIHEMYYMGDKDGNNKNLPNTDKINDLIGVLKRYNDVYLSQTNLTRIIDDDNEYRIRPTKKSMRKILGEAKDLKGKLYVGSDEGTKPAFNESGVPYLFIDKKGATPYTTTDATKDDILLLHLRDSLSINRLTITGLRDAFMNIVQAQETLVALQSQSSHEYPVDPKWNHYFHHPLVEWNFDYIMSLTLFDSKVLAARLISAIFGSVSMDFAYGLTLSWKQQFIQNEIKQILNRLINNPDDATVSDCFFTFTNRQDRDMARQATLQRAGLVSANGELSSASKKNSADALRALGELDYAGTKEERIEVFKGALFEASAELSDYQYDYDSTGFDELFNVKKPEFNISFMENLLTNLVTEVTMAVLSPKVYLCILMNMEIMGISGSMSLKDFIERFKGLVTRIVQQACNMVMEWFLKEVEKMVAELFSKFAVQISLEQAESYARLLRQIFDHIRQFASVFKTESTPWNVDRVSGADIEEEEKDISQNAENDPSNTTC